MLNGTRFVSRSWLLYLDDLIASAEKIGRLTTGWTIVICDVANRHVPALLNYALAVRDRTQSSGGADPTAES